MRIRLTYFDPGGHYYAEALEFVVASRSDEVVSAVREMMVDKSLPGLEQWKQPTTVLVDSEVMFPVLLRQEE